MGSGSDQDVDDNVIELAGHPGYYNANWTLLERIAIAEANFLRAVGIWGDDDRHPK